MFLFTNHLTLLDSTLRVMGPTFLEIFNSSFTWTSSFRASTSPPLSITNGLSFSMTNSAIEAPLSAPILFGGNAGIHITFMSSRLNTPIGLFKTTSTLRYSISSCVINMVGADPLRNDRVLLFNSPNATRVSISNSSITGLSTRQDSIINGSAVFDISNSALEGVNVFTVQGTLHNSAFVDVTLVASEGINFANTSFTQYHSEKYVSIAASTPLDMRNASFSNPNMLSSSYLELRSDNDELSFTPSSNLTVSDLRIQGGLTVLLGDAEITHTLSSDAPASIRSLTPSTTWNLHSIDISNAALNYTDLHHLIYTPSQASKGISYSGPPTLLSPHPPHFSIIWPSDSLHPPKFLQIYPVARFSREKILNSTIVELSPPLAPYTLVASYSGLTSTLMTFQSIDNPQPPPSCSNPPPGFACSPSGTLYAPGSVNQHSITIPSQSGAIVVGNVTVGSDITFMGAGSTLNVIGCVNIKGGITLDVDPEKTPPKGGITLLTQYDDCDTPDLNTIPLKVKLLAGSCKRVSLKADPASSKSQLTVLFVVDSSRCNVKWIIIGSVVGVALIIVVVICFIVGRHLRAREQRKLVKVTW